MDPTSLPCHSVSDSLALLNFVQFFGFVKVIAWIYLRCYINFWKKLIHWFLYALTNMDLSKLFYAFCALCRTKLSWSLIKISKLLYFKLANFFASVRVKHALNTCARSWILALIQEFVVKHIARSQNHTWCFFSFFYARDFAPRQVRKFAKKMPRDITVCKILHCTLADFLRYNWKHLHLAKFFTRPVVVTNMRCSQNKWKIDATWI